MTATWRICDTMLGNSEMKGSVSVKEKLEGCRDGPVPGGSGNISTRSPCWSDEGYRLLPAHFYFELSARMREFEQSFSKQVDDFLDFYPSYIEHVRPELNGLFREEDYPSADALRKKFGLKLEVLPIPSGDDFHVTMSAEERPEHQA